MGTFAFGLRAISCCWEACSAARRVAFSIRSWSTIVRHSSQRRFASSADASAASSNCERDSSVLTCLGEESPCGQCQWLQYEVTVELRQGTSGKHALPPNIRDTGNPNPYIMD